MSLIVQKFGGSSVATIERIKEVAKRIVKTKDRWQKVVVVVSAMGKTTNELIELAYKITSAPCERELDMLISTGEQVSSALLTITLNSLGHPAVSLTAQQVGILTDATHTKARIIKINTKRIEREIACGKIVVVTGFQGITEEKDITTLGRGGSDTTAVALAAVLEADICEIYTDVDGVYTTDPGVFRGARKLDSICYDEMLEMASTGAKVLQSRSVEFAKKYGVVLHVRSSFSKKEGTLVLEEVDRVEKMLVSGITSDINQAKITILKVPDRPGVAAQIFGALAEVAINVDMIIQSSSEGKFNDISFTVAKDDLKKALKNLEKPAKELNAAEVTADDGVGKISIIGVGMRTNPGVAAKMFSALAEGKINIEMISTSEIKISCIIRREHIEKATRLLHRTFELGKRRTKR